MGDRRNHGWIPYLGSRRARTFIGYANNSSKVKFGVMSSSSLANSIADDLTGNTGATYYDMYYILKNELGCNIGLALDGGGSSRYRMSSTSQVSASSDPNRNPQCQIAIT